MSPRPFRWVGRWMLRKFYRYLERRQRKWPFIRKASTGFLPAFHSDHGLFGFDSKQAQHQVKLGKRQLSKWLEQLTQVFSPSACFDVWGLILRTECSSVSSAVMPALRKQRQEDAAFETGLSYIEDPVTDKQTLRTNKIIL